MKRAFCVLGVLTALTSQTALAQEAVSPAEPALEELLTAKPAQIAPQTAKDALADALTQTESFACSEMMTFLQDTVLKDSAVMRAAETRNAADVAAVTAKYAIGAAKDLNADYLFYMPNPRFFVRVNDKNYRGRMRLPKDFSGSFSACYWENLPSGDVVYSVLVRASDQFAGYFKLSKTLPNMTANIPDMMRPFGEVRLYTALNKDNFRKRDWMKMRRKEPNKPEEFCWCSKENFAFLSTIGAGPAIPKKHLRKALAAIENGQPFAVAEQGAAGDSVMLKSPDGIALGAVAYLVKTP